jgi:hypothetical protein
LRHARLIIRLKPKANAASRGDAAKPTGTLAPAESRERLFN